MHGAMEHRFIRDLVSRVEYVGRDDHAIGPAEWCDAHLFGDTAKVWPLPLYFGQSP